MADTLSKDDVLARLRQALKELEIKEPRSGAILILNDLIAQLAHQTAGKG